MEVVTHKKLKGGDLMPWGKGTVVTGAKRFVFLSAIRQPLTITIHSKGGGAVGEAAAQWRNILSNIKSDLGAGTHSSFDQAYILREGTVPQRRCIEFS